jgi:tRNA dimethylallyltransferase
MLAKIPHHMIGVADPARPYSVAEYREEAGRAVKDILGRGKVPVVAGGAGLYIHALLYDMDWGGSKGDEAVRAEYERLAAERGRDYIHALLAEKDPKAAEKIHPNNLRRVIRALERVGAEAGQGAAPQGEPTIEDGRVSGATQSEPSGPAYKPFSFDLRKGGLIAPAMFLLTRERADLVRRIDERVEDMVKSGLVEEVEQLVRQGLTRKHISMLGIGYKETLGYLNRDYGLDEMTELVKIHTRRYAKRQMTWFKRYEDAHVINLTSDDFLRKKSRSAPVERKQGTST